MQILVHLGLNKCASTYIQQALAGSSGRLERHGVLYVVEDSRPAQYGLSRHYGFGPEVDGVTPRSLPWLVAEARRAGCQRIILSSEYLSLRRPASIAAFVGDLDRTGAEARFLLFSRDVTSWVRSLFNQYVKTVVNGPCFDSINGFIDHALANGAIDAAGRHDAWAAAVGSERISHFEIAPGDAPEAVLNPFADFARAKIPPPPAGGVNESLSPGALYLTYLLRQAPPSAGRDLLLASIAGRSCNWVPVPPGYLEIDAERAARLDALVARPLAALSRRPLRAAGDRLGRGRPDRQPGTGAPRGDSPDGGAR